MRKVSIFMSSYNYATYLHSAIDSVLDQTFSDYELFILDDASTDDSWSIIQSYTDPRIHSYRNPTNRNDREWMRKVIFEMASGEYIAVHHSDNIWDPQKLQKQVDYLDAHPDIGATFTRVQLIGTAGEELVDKSKIFEQPNRNRYEWLNYFFYKGNTLCHPSILIRKKCYDECGFYRNGLAQIPDFDMWVRLCMKYEIYILPERLVRYRVQSDQKNISGYRPETRIRSQFEYLQVLDNYLEINTFEELVKIFPNAQKYYHEEGYDIGYILGMLALETSKQPFKQLFGLNLLFKALNDPSRTKRINDLYGFFHKNFTALTTRYDIFSVELNRETSKNRIWKAAKLLHGIRVYFLPPGSQRVRIIRKISSTIISPFSRLNNHKT